MLRCLTVISLAVTLVWTSTLPGTAQSTAPFYKGKTITLSIGFGSGGANDAWSRAIARHMPRHLTGEPLIVVQHVPGAGGLQLVNYLANISPRDGTAIGLISRGLPFEPILGGGGTQFDPLKLNWIGSPDRDITVCAARKDTAVQTMRDLFTHELIVGGTGSGADTVIYPEFLAALLGMKFKIVKGYKGSNEIMVALERGEVHGICFAYDSLMRTPLAREGKINILFQAGLAPHPKLAQVPVPIEVARGAEERAVLELFLARIGVGRPFVAPPGLPSERVEQLRAAFLATMADREFVTEAEKQGLGVDPVPGAEIAQIIAAAYATPKPVVERTATAIGRSAK